MKKTFLFILLIIMTSAAQAATTASVPLSTTVYTDLGAGPMILGAANGNVLYQQSAVQPSLASPALLEYPGAPAVQFTGTAHVWAIGSGAAGITVSAIVTTGTDVFAAGALQTKATSLADHSGTITLGGTAQTISAANPLRQGFFIQNISSNDIWVSTLTTAVPGQPSMLLPSGARWSSEAPFVGPISIYGSTTGQPYTMQEW